MKRILLMIAMVALVGCGKQEQSDANESTPTTNTNEVDGATEKPVEELTPEEKVVGTYEVKKDGNTLRMVVLENGVMESYENSKKREAEAKWTIINGEIHLEVKDGYTVVLRINKDKSITNIAIIDKGGEREDTPKENQQTAKKIK